MPKGFPVDLTGQRFGGWTVRGRAGVDNSGTKVLWDCACDCGRTASISTGNLTLGKSRRCRPCSSSRQHSPRWKKEGEK